MFYSYLEKYTQAASGPFPAQCGHYFDEGLSLHVRGENIATPCPLTSVINVVPMLLVCFNLATYLDCIAIIKQENIFKTQTLYFILYLLVEI